MGNHCHYNISVIDGLWYTDKKRYEANKIKTYVLGS